MASAPARRRCPRPGALHPSLLVFAIALAALLTAFVVPQAYAEVDDVLGTELHWDGDVEVSTNGMTAMTRPTLEVREGQSATYYIRLSHDPIYYRHDENNMEVLVPCPEAGTPTERQDCSWWTRYRLNGVLIDSSGEWDIDG